VVCAQIRKGRDHGSDSALMRLTLGLTVVGNQSEALDLRLVLASRASGGHA
jgi:hypothetical protein